MPLPLAPVVTGTVTAVAAKAIDSGSSLLARITKAVALGNPVQSLADVAKPARVEPLVLIEKSLGGQPYTEDILKASLSTFTGYYMQAVALTLNINRVETLRVLDALNPERSFVLPSVRRGVADAVWSTESYEHGLPSLEQFDRVIPLNAIVSIEDAVPAAGLSGGVSDDSVKNLYEAGNLAVGKIVNVEFQDSGKTVKIPVMIRLVPTLVPAQVLTHIFTATTKNSSWKERYHLWRAGQISFVRDLMFSMDIIDEHRRALINDTSNVYMTLTDRRRNNSLKAVSSGNPSMADASNIAVITKETAKAIGSALYGKIEQLSIRKKIFDASYLMLLVVVDEQWERVTIYHRGFDQPTEVSFKEIKNAEKGKGPDITEILKAYQVGSTPSF